MKNLNFPSDEIIQTLKKFPKSFDEFKKMKDKNVERPLKRRKKSKKQDDMLEYRKTIHEKFQMCCQYLQNMQTLN